MQSRSKVIQEARARLEKSDVPAQEWERLLNLLNFLLASVDDSVFNSEETVSGLIEAMASNGNLLIVIEQQAAELDALKRITLNLTSSLELQHVLDAVVKEAMQLVKEANDAHIYLYENQALVFGASLKSNGDKNKVLTEPRKNGLTHTVAREQKLIVVEDMSDHPLFREAPKEWSGSIMGIPLMMGQRVVGVMNLARTRTGDFSQSEIRLLTLLADQAAIAIINARLHFAVSQQARSDMLTGLPNRRALDERLDDEISISLHSGRPFGVVMMDLDGFKSINDTYGHDCGDAFLRQIANHLQASLRGSDFLARYGGDEMTLILPDTDLPQAAYVARKVQAQLTALNLTLPDGKPVTLGVTGGIALFPKHADTASGLLRAADEALYKAKKYARGTFMAARGPTGQLTTPRNLNSN
ncbi:MAG: sensor domain-containing diguanylate cyclase [Anaerolineales bacterium]|nr:sensor domain-containing diguanylate cyclase [Anaerolineales bacterium]